MDEGFWMNLQEPFFILHPYYSLFCSENQVLFQLFLFFFLYCSPFILCPYYRLSFEKNQAFFPKFPVNFYIKSSAVFYLFYHLFEYYYTTLMQ